MSELNQLKQKLISQYPYKFELHAHTNPASGCSELLVGLYTVSSLSIHAVGLLDGCDIAS